MANDEEELQRLTSDDSDATPAYKPASRSPCIKHFGGGLMLLPLPHGSELRITVSASSPARRRKFITALVAGTAHPARSILCDIVMTARRYPPILLCAWLTFSLQHCSAV